MSDLPNQNTNFDNYKRDAERARKLATRLFEDRGIPYTVTAVNDLLRIPGTRRIITSLEEVRKRFLAKHGATTAATPAPAVTPVPTGLTAMYGVPVAFNGNGMFSATVVTEEKPKPKTVQIIVRDDVPAAFTAPQKGYAPKAEEYLEWLSDSFGYVLLPAQRDKILSGVEDGAEMKTVVNRKFMEVTEGKAAEDKKAADGPAIEAVLNLIPKEFLNRTPKKQMLTEIESQITHLRQNLSHHSNTVNTLLGQLRGLGERKDALLDNNANTLDKEIREVIASGHWTDFEFRNNRLNMLTSKDVIVRAGDSDMNLGRFVVTVRLDNFDIRVVAIGGNKFVDNNGAPHPFVDHNGVLCWGQFLPTVQGMFESGRFSQMMSALFALLTTFDPRSTNIPFVRYEDLRRAGKDNPALLRRHLLNYRGYANSIDKALGLV